MLAPRRRRRVIRQLRPASTALKTSDLHAAEDLHAATGTFKKSDNAQTESNNDQRAIDRRVAAAFSQAFVELSPQCGSTRRMAIPVCLKTKTAVQGRKEEELDGPGLRRMAYDDSPSASSALDEDSISSSKSSGGRESATTDESPPGVRKGKDSKGMRHTWSDL